MQSADAPVCATGSAADALDPAVLAAALHAVESGVASGFQLASAAGPLCDEPMWGVAFEVGCLYHEATLGCSSLSAQQLLR